MDNNNIEQNIIEEIDKLSPQIIKISSELHKNPELQYKEFFAVEYLSKILCENGFTLSKGIANLETAFSAKIQSKEKLTIAFIAEYDALPGIGHACGHNLIAAISIGAGIALAKAGMAKYGKIMVIGTPAEEGGGGKVHMVNRGIFNNVDVALMAHPAPHTRVLSGMLAIMELTFTFKGVSAHAAAFPFKGVNALDGVILTFNNINALRQQIRGDARIHGIITEGGKAPNIIPEKAEARFFVRAIDLDYFEQLVTRVKKCATGAAEASGCELNIKIGDVVYHPFKPNNKLANIFRKRIKQFDISEDDLKHDECIGSSDIGNVSQKIPTLHAEFSVGPKNVINHSQEFTDILLSKHAINQMIKVTKSIALTAADLFMSPQNIDSVKNNFKEVKK